MSYEAPDFRTQVLKIALNDRKQLVQMGFNYHVRPNQVVHISRTRGRKKPYWGVVYCRQPTDPRPLKLVEEHRLNGVKHIKPAEFASRAQKLLEEILAFENTLANAVGMSFERRREVTCKFYRKSEDLEDFLTKRNDYMEEKYVDQNEHADWEKFPRKLCTRCFYLYQKKKMNSRSVRGSN